VSCDLFGGASVCDSAFGSNNVVREAFKVLRSPSEFFLGSMDGGVATLFPFSVVSVPVPVPCSRLPIVVAVVSGVFVCSAIDRWSGGLFFAHLVKYKQLSFLLLFNIES
jgi:hypothetical protein